ncbi:Uncharacterized protein PCOAH_00040430 [Plasmodium coatneyi]|uniref:Uncharacterized protein n=1 Tax=Plasmodium coatneyi TaxID=208452 RepID=A0A1B1E5N9_9APIC|nr:Uncharacterized protein PCOAH_00040430 [Plasmodium coatneyi]ANQ10354.1 Uncharacterized protein PCOAH_00040430 [Plasmodium coatneyi]
MAPLSRILILTFILIFWQYANYVIPLDILYDNGTSQNGSLNIITGRSLMSETEMRRPQKSKFLASPKGGPPGNTALDGKSKTSNSKTKSEESQCTKSKAMNEKMKNGRKGFFSKLAYASNKNKEWIFLALAIIFFYPVALYCIGLFVKTYNTLPPYSWTICYITVPIIMVYILLSALVGTCSWWK